MIGIKQRRSPIDRISSVKMGTQTKARLWKVKSIMFKSKDTIIP